MEIFFNKLFMAHGAAQAILVLSLTMGLGVLLGRIKIFGISFGVGGILFSGIILAHFGLSLNPAVLAFAREFGLIFFVYAIGLSVGPTFLESLRDQGLRLNCASIYIVSCGIAIALFCRFFFDLGVPQTAGIFCGSVTNTPALGAAGEAWTLVAPSPQDAAPGQQIIGLAYAVCYPFGIFGIILTMMILKGLFHINVQEEIEGAEAASQGSGFRIAEAAHGMGRRRILVSELRAAGEKPASLAPEGVRIAGVRRGARELADDGSLKLRLADEVIADSASPEALNAFAAKLGDNADALAHPQLLPIFAAVSFGLMAGSVPFAAPGLPASLKLGVAVGVLLTAIFLARKQRFCGLCFYMAPAANQFMREMGIMLFLACVGLNAGAGFLETLTNGPGLSWMGMGALVTFIPLCSAALFCRLVWKINFPAICGMLAGCSTQPAALAFAMEYYGPALTAQAYSTVYPLTMILRIMAGQLLVMLLAG